jgi:DNA-binding MarR family transcriptional regulator
MNSQEKERIARISAMLHELLIAPDDAATSAGVPSSGQLVALAKQEIRARRKRQELFPNIQVADPAWDLLLELFIHQAEARRISVTGLGLGANVPGATVLRWLAMFHEAGLIVREPDAADRRRIWVYLTEAGRERIAQGISCNSAPAAALPGIVSKTSEGRSLAA